MRVLRMLGAGGAWLVATLLLVLAVVLSVTIVLLPVGVLLGIASFRLYKLGLKWALPRASDVQMVARKEARRLRRRPAVRKLRRSTPLGKRGRRRARRTLRRTFR